MSHEQRSATRKSKPGDISRRSLLGASAAAAVLPFLISGRARASQRIAVTCWGGDYQKGVQTCFVDPFTKETGIGVTLVNNGDLAKMKAQVETNSVQWDVFDSVGAQITAGAKAGLWDEIDPKIVDRSDLIAPGAKYYVPTYMFAGGVGWDPKRDPDGKHPVDFKGFWDAKTYPGRRGLRTRISETLEMALIADGVPPRHLYPLDVERGFKSLDRMKPLVQKWIETTPETVTLITNNEVDFTYTYATRVRPAEKAGLPIDFSFEQTINSLEYLAVPKHSRNREAAMRYVAFCLRPDRQAAFAETLSFTPNTKTAISHVSDQARRWMPDMTNPNNVIMDDAWWSDRYEALQKRYTEWMLV